MIIGWIAEYLRPTQVEIFQEELRKRKSGEGRGGGLEGGYEKSEGTTGIGALYTA
jgi:hypothetical protein